MSNASSLTTLITWIIATLAGVVFVALALRGRREATAPRCRQCGYDVSRRPAGVDRCSECGADLTRPRAIATSRRRPRWVRAAIASLWLAFALAMTFAAARQLDWHALYLRRAPTSWLIADARRDHSTKGDEYRLAWRDRGDRRREYYDHLLDLQRDVAGRPNLSPMFGGMEDAFLDGKLTQAQRQRYVEGLYQNVTIEMARRVRVGGELPWKVSGVDRSGTMTSRRLTFGIFDGWSFDGRREVKRGGATSSQISGDFAGDSADWLRGEWEPVTPGVHRVTLRITLQVGRYTSGPASNDYASQVWPDIDTTQTFDVDVLPRGATLGTPIVDPSQGDAIARAVDIQLRRASGRLSSSGLTLGPVPIDRAFRVSLVVDGVERRIGTVCARANEGGEFVPDEATLFDLPVSGPTVTLVLDADSESLVHAFDQQRYWAGRITYADVPIANNNTFRLSPFVATAAPYTVAPATTMPSP